ncbi:phasin family protein [Hymenobacter nivis]|uniref:Polyhydroxyalkanoate synthesis regulator n=1 Tax=Hymenobacter nivis TaxID=1850093 RepID=A0A2Z3GG86_9BACT|nr:hypothetical protein [Hymenobacter nivis]AWM32789.1 hypothetical protein DDQ68_08350 [Hymenobacter nivis]
MEDLFKKFINAGVGYLAQGLAQGNKKVQSTIDALVKDSKLSEQEGKKIVDDLLKSGETKRTELEQQLKGLADRMKDSVGLKGKTKDNAPAASAKKAPAKKAPAKKAGAPKAAGSVASKVAGATQKAAGQVSAPAKARAPKAPAKPRAAARKPAAGSSEA